MPGLFTDLVLFGTSGPSGGHIFLDLKKDMEERQTKGLAALWKPANTGEGRGDVRTSYEFALVQLTRFRPVRGVRKRTVSTDSCVLRPDGDAQHRRKKCPWGALLWKIVGSTVNWAPHPKGTSSGDAGHHRQGAVGTKGRG